MKNRVIDAMAIQVNETDKAINQAVLNNDSFEYEELTTNFAKHARLVEEIVDGILALAKNWRRVSELFHGLLLARIKKMKKSKYIFESERLGFRNWTDEDVVEFSKLNADEEVMEHFPKTLSQKEVEVLIEKLRSHFVKNGFTYYATEILETGEFIGMIGLAFQEYKTEFTPAIDIGWRLKKGAWGKGYATEGAKRCLKYAFDELAITKVIAVCTIRNNKSENVMKKIGMTKIGTFNHPELVDYPEYEKHFCYQISKEF